MAQSWQSNDSSFVDTSQLIKRLDWLDEERRKDKDTISLLQEQIIALQGENHRFSTLIQDIQNEITDIGLLTAKQQQLELEIKSSTQDLSRRLADSDRNHSDRENEIDGFRQNAQESLSRAILDTRKQLEPIADLKKAIQARMDDVFSLTRRLEELDHKIDKIALERDDFLRFQKTNEEVRKQMDKRLTDMQNELSVYRKRNDEMKNKVDLSSDAITKIEQRVAEIGNAENERKQQVTSFQEKMASADVKREKLLNEWKTTFDEIVEKSSSMEMQFQSLDAIRRSVKHSQEALDEATGRFDRRTNEITEMQRLMEEKFRQEWATFKSDDQKRWMNYSLGQDEIQSEYKRNVELMTTRLNKLEDTTVITSDEAAQNEERRTAQMQEVYALLRSWLEKK